jgi:ketosteroid isomerase-like protein
VSNEATIRASYDAWTRRDIDGLIDLVHPESVARPILGANLEADVYHGHEGARRWLTDLHQEWETFETTVNWIEERGDRAVCAFQIHARGRASGAVIDGELYHLLAFRDGRIVRLEAFRDRDAAMDALEAT